jgi:uridine phosphorylase
MNVQSIDINLLLRDHYVANFDMQRIRSSPNWNPGPFSASDLLINDDGSIYHLEMKPEDLAKPVNLKNGPARLIICVGDPGRALEIGENFLENIRFSHQHRGLYTVTGTIPGSDREVTIATTGMGTPSEEIIIQELVALNEIDFNTRCRKNSFPQLSVIRVGTSGILSSELPIGKAIVTLYAVGTDNAGLFYDVDYLDPNCEALENLVAAEINSRVTNPRYKGKFAPYAVPSDGDLVQALVRAGNDLGIANEVGITISSAGFFAAQGRNIARVQPTFKDADRMFDTLSSNIRGVRFLNMEMEQSLSGQFLGGSSHKTAAICLGIANRSLETFDADYKQGVQGVCRMALRAQTLLE